MFKHLKFIRGYSNSLMIENYLYKEINYEFNKDYKYFIEKEINYFAKNLTTHIIIDFNKKDKIKNKEIKIKKEK